MLRSGSSRSGVVIVIPFEPVGWLNSTISRSIVAESICSARISCCSICYFQTGNAGVLQMSFFTLMYCEGGVVPELIIFTHLLSSPRLCGGTGYSLP